MPKEENDEFHEEQENPKRNILKNMLEYMSESSLFIFHQNSWIRIFMIKLTVSSKEARAKKQKREGNPFLMRVQNIGLGNETQDDGGDYFYKEKLDSPASKFSKHGVHSP